LTLESESFRLEPYKEYKNLFRFSFEFWPFTKQADSVLSLSAFTYKGYDDLSNPLEFTTWRMF
jgi:hypothetical protein